VLAAKVVGLAALGAAFTYEMGVNRNLTTNGFFNTTKAQGMPWVVVLLAILYACGTSSSAVRHTADTCALSAATRGLAAGRRGVPHPDLGVRHLLRHSRRIRHDRDLAANDEPCRVDAIQIRRRSAC
jgi:hypothetical protein